MTETRDDCQGHRMLIDPDARVGAARDRVARFEQAIAAMVNCQGPELEMLITSLKKAQKDAQEMPLEAHIRAREAFIERSKKRIEQFDVERAAESRGWRRVRKDWRSSGPWFLFSQLHHSLSNDSCCTIGRLSNSEVGRGRLHFRHGGGGLGVVGRPAGRHEHGADGWESCGSRTHLWIDHPTRSLRPTGAEPSMVSNMIVARRSSRYGMRGRVGEASKPGSQLSRQRSPSQGSTEESVMPASEELMDAMQEDFEGTQVRRRTRRRVLSDDDLLLTQVLPVFSHKASRRVVLVPGASGDTPHSGPDRSDSGEDGDATQVAHHEGAPVDATAVELPSSPHTSVVDALELDLSVPAFDPMESGVPTCSSEWFSQGIAWSSFSVGVQHCGCFQGS